MSPASLQQGSLCNKEPFIVNHLHSAFVTVADTNPSITIAHVNWSRIDSVVAECKPDL